MGGGVSFAESMTYDPVTGALLAWDTNHPDPTKAVVRQFDYDGSGRLRWAFHQGPPSNQTTDLFYDTDDGLTLEKRTTNLSHNLQTG